MPEYRVLQANSHGMTVTDIYALLGKAYADCVFYQQRCADLESQLRKLVEVEKNEQSNTEGN